MDTEKEKGSGANGISKPVMEETKEKMEADRKAGSFSGEEEPVMALARFPEEVWCKLLSFLIVPRDIINVSKTCWDLNGIIERKRLEWVPPVRMVMPFIVRYLSKSDIRNCRLVSRGLCYDVESFLLSHPYRKFYSDANYSTTDDMSIFATTLICRRFWKLPFVEKYLKQFEDHFEMNKRNPFVGRTLHLKLNGQWKLETHSGFIRQIENEFLLDPSFVEHIWNVMITCDDVFDDVWRLWQLFQKMFQRLRNIKSVVVDLQGCVLDREERAEFWQNGKRFPLTPLLHSRPITVEFIGWNYPIAMLNQMIVNQCHPQLARIDMDLAVSKYFLKEYKCPIVRSLRLISMTYQDIILLKERFSAPLLVRLTLDWRTVMKSVSPGSVDLEILAAILTKFKRLKVVNLQGLGPEIKLHSCSWNRTTKSCHPRRKPDGRLADVTNHDEAHHESTIWMLMPETVKEFYLNERKFVRPRPTDLNLKKLRLS